VRWWSFFNQRRHDQQQDENACDNNYYNFYDVFHIYLGPPHSSRTQNRWVQSDRVGPNIITLRKPQNAAGRAFFLKKVSLWQMVDFPPFSGSFRDFRPSPVVPKGVETFFLTWCQMVFLAVVTPSREYPVARTCRFHFPFVETTPIRRQGYGMAGVKSGVLNGGKPYPLIVQGFRVRDMDR
jgi:hypothetical protein